MKIPDGLTLKDILNINAFLINAGAKKSEIVTVRNHMSLVKGGRLLDYFRAKKIINIVLSDVLSNNYNEVSSGPTMWDFTTYKDAYEILCRYRIKEKISQNALKYFEKMIKKPKNIAKNLTDEKIKVTSNYVIANNKVLVERTIDRARQLGFNTSIDLLSLEFEAHQIARRLSDNAREISLYGRPIQKPACIISSGFTNTSNMFYKKSGMNLNLALITATEIKDMNETFVLTGNSSGYDGITDSAGAVVDGATFKQAQKKKMRIDEYLKNNDSYGFFKKMNHLVKTGNSGTCLGNIFITCIF